MVDCFAEAGSAQLSLHPLKNTVTLKKQQKKQGEGDTSLSNATCLTSHLHTFFVNFAVAICDPCKWTV